MEHHQGAPLRASMEEGRTDGLSGKRREDRSEKPEKAEKPAEGEDRSSPSGQGVLDGVGECVAQVQGAGHIGGWDAHHEDSPGIWC